MKTKSCSNCKELKSIEEYHINKNLKSGLQSSCKKCISERYKTERYKSKWKIKYEEHKYLGNINKWKNNYLKKHKSDYLLEFNNNTKKLLDFGFIEISFNNKFYINSNGDIYKLCSFQNYMENKSFSVIKINPKINFYGYKIVCISKEYRVHQLVAMHFLNHTPNKHHLVIDHIDGNKLNNNASNLQIITNHQNLVKGKYSKNKNEKLLKYLENISV
jgi:hypothetical protein